MKAITIWQPWASLIAAGEKKYETRSWSTKYRGPIAIHAALRDPCKLPITPELERYALHNKAIGDLSALTTGAIIATAELVNVWYIVHHPGTDIDEASKITVGAESLTTDKHAPDFGNYFVPTVKELALGNWTPGHYAWELCNVKPLRTPIPIKGKQGLWNWQPTVLRLTHKGRDNLGRPVYEDENGKLWKDTEPREYKPAKLYSVLNNEFEGEPDTPMEATRKYDAVEIVLIPQRDTW